MDSMDGDDEMVPYASCATPGYRKLHVILDAMNIARGYKDYCDAPEGSAIRNALDIEGLQLCFQYFHKNGIYTKAFAAKGFIEVWFRAPFLPSHLGGSHRIKLTPSSVFHEVAPLQKNSRTPP
jgi:hypothetical protein